MVAGSPRNRLFAAWVGLLMTELLHGSVSSAFSNVSEGDRLPATTLPSLHGGRQGFLREGKVSVFMFIRPGQEHSRKTLIELQQVKARLRGKPVHWSAIVSDSHGRREVEEIARALRLDMPVLIDVDDQLYAQLGVILHPVVGITDRKRRLKAYLPYRSIHLASSVEAQVLHALGEIDARQLEQMLNPSAAVDGGDPAKARRNWRMAKSLYAMQKFKPALEAARKSTELDPAFAEAHALLGAILAEAAGCAAARPALDRAMRLDPQNATAVTVNKVCPAPDSR